MKFHRIGFRTNHHIPTSLPRLGGLHLHLLVAMSLSIRIRGSPLFVVKIDGLDFLSGLIVELKDGRGEIERARRDGEDWSIDYWIIRPDRWIHGTKLTPPSSASRTADSHPTDTKPY